MIRTRAQTLPRAIAIATAISASLFATLATAQINLPPPGQPGSSPDTAIRINAVSDIQADTMIRRWLRNNYPGWSHSSKQLLDMGDRVYAVVTVTSSGQSSRRVYFYISSRMGQDPDDF